MSKFYIKIENPNLYTDNRFGSLIEALLVDSYQDAIVIFNGFVVFIEYDKESRIFELSMHKLIEDDENSELISVDANLIDSLKTDNYKYVGYNLLRLFRKVYSEETDLFPVDQMKFWFLPSIDSYTHFIEVEN